MKVAPKHFDYAKYALLTAFESAVDDYDVKVADEHLTKSVEIALDYLAIETLCGPHAKQVLLKKESA